MKDKIMEKLGIPWWLGLIAVICFILLIIFVFMVVDSASQGVVWGKPHG
jgi:hypothetical protein